MSDTNASRRHFLQLAAASALAPVLAGNGFASEAVSESDPTAKALGYKADASSVGDTSYRQGSTCANCLQFEAGAEGVGACALFPGKSVSASGWCKAWVKKT